MEWKDVAPQDGANSQSLSGGLPVTTVTQFLAAEMHDTRWADIPEIAREAARRLLVDQVGITFMGAAFTGSALHAYAAALGGAPDALLFGTTLRVPSEVAAGINAQVCRNTNFEESGPGYHIGPLCVHVALAVGQQYDRSGAEILAAIATGYMHSVRFHAARRADKGSPHLRTVGAAIAAKLMGLSAEQIATAMSLAWESPFRNHSFPIFAPPPTAKRISPIGMQMLYHARAGVQAATMIRVGFPALRDEVDRVVAAEYDAGVLTGPAPWQGVNDQMELKPWVSSRHCQAALQAIWELQQQRTIDPRAVTAVRLKLSAMYLRPHQWEPAPNVFFEAIYSTQWAVSMLLQQLPPGPKWVTAERLADPFSRALASKVTITEDVASTTAYGNLRPHDVNGIVEIDVGGETLHARTTMGQVYGSGHKPMPDAMQEQKFMEATSLNFPEKKARELLAALRGFEEVGSVGEVVG